MNCKKLFILLINFLNLIYHTCELTIPCGSPGYPYHGFYNVSQNSKSNTSFKSGTTVKYYCNSGAILFGHSKRHCFKSGHWDNKIPQCAHQLNLKKFIDLTHAKSAVNLKAIDGNNKSCFSGSVLIHEEKIYHSWEIFFTQVLLIKAIRLLFSRELSNSAQRVDYTLWIQTRSSGKKVECTHTKTITFDDMYSYEHSCVGITEGDALLIDSANAERFMLCEVVIFALNIDDEHKCGTPDTPSNGFVNPLVKASQKHAVFGCNEGFVLNGAKQLQCTDSGLWSALTPLCFPEKYVQSVNKSKSNIVVDTAETKSPDSKSRDDSIINCRNISETNGTVYYSNGLHVNSDARLVCNNGYKTAFADTIKCLPNGSWSHNNGKDFSCHIIQCKISSKILISSGKMLKLAKNETKANYRSTIEVVCDSDVQQNNIEVRYCGESGAWVQKTDIDNKTAISDLPHICSSVTNKTNKFLAENESKQLDMNSLIIVSSIAALTTTAILLVLLCIVMAFRRNCFRSVKSDRISSSHNQNTTMTAMNDFSLIEIKHNIANRRRLSDASHIYHSPNYEMVNNDIETRVMSRVKFSSRRNTSFVHNYSEPFDMQSNESSYDMMGGSDHENIYAEPYVTIENEIYSSNG